MQGARKRGVSLIELLISAGLMGLCLSAVHMLIVAGNRYLRVSTARHEIQSQALICLSWLARELSETDPDSYKVSNTPALQGIVFGSPRDPSTGQTKFDTLGRMLWPKFICYYRTPINGVDCLVRKAQDIVPPNEYPPPPPPVASISGAGGLNTRVLGRHVTDFQVQQASPINITLQLSMDQALGKNYAIQVSTKVFPRN